MERKQTTNMEVKKNNRNRVFRYICKKGTVSNPDIAYDTKMSLPTVTQITKELIEEGLVEEKGELQSTGGRRAKALSAAVNVKQAVGMDITQNHIALILTNLTGEILNYVRIFLPYEHGEAYYQKVNSELEKFLEDCGTDRKVILGMGISFPGIVDADRRLIDGSHVLGVKNLPFDSVSGYFNYSCSFMNDANAGAYAEGWSMEAAENFFYLSLSNTVGGAVFHGGELIQGKNFRCGEAGHMTMIPGGKVCYCGKKGCLDAYCSAVRLSDQTEGKLELFFRELESGDRQAVQSWQNYTDVLAVAINNIHMVLDCDIILGGYVGSYVKPYITDIWEKVAGRNTFAEDRPFIRECKYRVGAAALGAALHVIETFIKQI